MSLGIGYRGAGVLKSLILVALFMFSLFSIMAPQADLDDEFVPNYSSGLETLLWGEMVAGSSSTDS
ncbi:MAG TPA: hypothetical protein QF433_05555, partial [Candidatus Thalassarchaeaceae archaeon]|nr:hypothetical protein [Candidatus Thalassarchaeaceae archaeon]